MRHQSRPLRRRLLAQLLPRRPSERHRYQVGQRPRRWVVAQVPHGEPIPVPHGGLRRLGEDRALAEHHGQPTRAVHRHALVFVREQHVAARQVALPRQKDPARVEAHEGAGGAPHLRSHTQRRQGLRHRRGEDVELRRGRDIARSSGSGGLGDNGAMASAGGSRGLKLGAEGAERISGKRCDAVENPPQQLGFLLRGIHAVARAKAQRMPEQAKILNQMRAHRGSARKSPATSPGLRRGV
mmetsp:Transcript_78344/g.226531  ORF Transcript_78344/g.226531 Transcript_78344/m.226531 type:complete len:240 (+) Transcript_78344:355-1074(+)